MNAGASSRLVKPARLERRDRQPEPRDRHRERVEVDAVHRVQRSLHPLALVQPRRVLVPAVEQPLEAAEQEVARPAGRVDHLEAFERPLGERRLQGAVEDELLDEDRRLEQRVPLLRVLGDVLVEVAEEAGVEVRVGEVAQQRAARRRARARS